MSSRRGSKLEVGDLGQADKPPEYGAHPDIKSPIDKSEMKEHRRGGADTGDEDGEEEEEDDDDEDEEDEDEGEDEDEEEDKLYDEKKQILVQITAKIKEFTKGTTQLDRDKFLVEHGDDLDYIFPVPNMDKKKGVRYSPGNVLHILAQTNFKKGAHFPTWILDYIHNNAQNQPEAGGRTRNSLLQLMKDKSFDSLGWPLPHAVNCNNAPFIKAVLGCEKKYGIKLELEENLGALMPNNKDNVIHHAIDHLEPMLAVQLIRRAQNDECLLAPNGEGYTPLHLAVKYPDCLGRLPIIKALLKYGEEALTKPSRSGQSVYQYYEATKLKALQAEERRKKELSAAAASGTSTPSGVASRPFNDGEELTKGPKDRGKKKQPETPVIKDDRERGKINLSAPKEDGNHDAGEVATGVAQSQPSGGPQITLKRRRTETTHAETATTKPKKDKKNKVGNNRPRARASAKPPKVKCKPEEVEDEIKLQYMRGTWKHLHTGNPDWSTRTVDKFLYSKAGGKQSGWSLMQGPKSVDEYVFRGIYEKWNFESTLHHVAVRRMMLTPPDSGDAGRTDMEILFKLLRDKEVRHIVKLIVIDLEKPAHSDMSIENCLSGFKTIEIFDWRKIDICPQTIIKACPAVVELHLYWSGTNGILGAWSAIDGLATLPRLETVYIHQKEHFETPARDTTNLEAFKAKLKQSRDNQQGKWAKTVSQQQTAEATLDGGGEDAIEVLDSWQDINVNCDDTSMKKQRDQSPKQHNLRQGQLPRQLQRYEWLKVMDNFAAGVRWINLEGDELPGHQSDVRVALIDDGVEITDEKVANRIYGGWTCESGYKDDGLQGIPRSHTSSETEHGTYMATTIVRVCPKAQIYVFRLDAQQAADGRTHFTAKSAADALELAVDEKMGFDIISMSWNIIESTDQESLTRIAESLAKATKHGKVLLFCATPDQGELSNQKENLIYPSGVKSAGLFKIAGATEFGVRMSSAGTAYEFLLPGHEVGEAPGAGNEARRQLQLQWQGGESKGGENKSGAEKTGSSVATALGAGLAALIMHCMRLTVVWQELRGKEKRIVWDNIRDPPMMRRIFAEMANSRSTKPGDNPKYVDVWPTFHDAAEKLKPLGEKVKGHDAQIRKFEAQRDMKVVEKLKKERMDEIDKMMAIIVELAESFKHK